MTEITASVSGPASTPVRRESVLAVGGLLVATLLFGGYFVAGRHGALVGLGSADLVALRYAIPLVVFLPVLLRTGLTHLGGVGWARGAVLTLFGGSPYAFVVLVALHFAPAVHAAVINPGLTPISGVLLSRVILGERPPPGAVVGIPLSLAGVVLVAGAALWSTAAPPGSWIGDVILVFSAVSYGLYTVLLRRWRIAPVPATVAINVLSGLIWLPCYAAVVGLQPLLAAPVGEVVGQAIFQGVFAGALAGFLYVRGVHVLGSAVTALFPALVPMFGTVLAAGLLGEHVSPLQVVGIAAAVAGMLIPAWRRQRAERATA